MRIAIDGMGGDNAPKPVVLGTIMAAREHPDWQLILTGKKELLSSFGELPPNVFLEAADEAVAMDEHVESLRHKQNSSIWVATRLVKEGRADAIISAGSTGAQMATALMILGRIKGIKRPAIGVVLPTLKGPKLLLDGGANTEARSDILCQFAMMGSIYYEKALQVASPRVALLSNGRESGKGTEVVCKTHELLSQSSLNFVGNREGSDIPFGEDFDVLVTDGFTGNVALKTAEGVSKMLFTAIKQQLTANLKNKIAAAVIKPALYNVKKLLDAEEHGGAPLLGVNGVSIVCHGSSDAMAIKNAIQKAAACVESGFVAQIAGEMDK